MLDATLGIAALVLIALSIIAVMGDRYELAIYAVLVAIWLKLTEEGG